jgi:hypothetical protein
MILKKPGLDLRFDPVPRTLEKPIKSSPGRTEVTNSPVSLKPLPIPLKIQSIL